MGSTVTMYWTPAVGQTLYICHLICSLEALSSPIDVLTLHGVFMRTDIKHVPAIRKWLPLNKHPMPIQCFFFFLFIPSALLIKAPVPFYPNPFCISRPSLVLNIFISAFFFDTSFRGVPCARNWNTLDNLSHGDIWLTSFWRLMGLTHACSATATKGGFHWKDTRPWRRAGVRHNYHTSAAIAQTPEKH